jgi:WD40 repeat protein
MNNQKLAVAIAAENDRSLQRLIRAIALSESQFALILVRCNYQRLRKQMLLNFRERAKNLNIKELILTPSIAVLHTSILKELELDYNAGRTSALPSALMVFGLETVTALDDLLTGINQARDIYAASFPFPLVLWLSDEVAASLSRLAPDFKSWGATTIKFELPVAELITLVRQETDALFTKVLDADPQKFLSNAALDLDPKSQLRHEMETARNDLLRLHDITLEPELEASLQFVLGRDDYANDEIAKAVDRYKRSLEFWNSQIPTITEQLTSPTASFMMLDNLLKKGVVLFHLGLCYRRFADLQPALNKRHWYDAFQSFKKCLEAFDAAQRKDLVAKFILSACEVLYRLQEWDALERMAQQALRLHEIYGGKAQIAEDYGFLAAVALQESNWKKADELVNVSLVIAEESTEVSRQQESWYLLLLSRAQRYLGELEEAVTHLEWAKVVCELQYEPALYLEILEELRSLYFFELHEYLEAFRLKQEKIQIEHQYGFRAFIGASQLQPQRYKINSALDLGKSPKTLPLRAGTEEVAQEIAASGRQQDINRLLTRLSRADCKLTVIYGPSGVGKSSILKAGLVPALKRKAIGERMALPVVLSAYTDWVRALGRSLNQPIEQTESAGLIDVSPATIISKLRLLSERNCTVILIFDQFEEFFFVSKQHSERREFYKFLIDSLNIPFVKVILSLREDYLHYLLEGERLSKNDSDRAYNFGVINNNILDKDIRYYLGKFQSQDAISVIHSLTKRSHYELPDELVNQLVQDLATETEEIHPIELQIVGAQLQSENITTLQQYLHCGGSEKLVERWLEEVTKDCGLENEQLTWEVLFELTDEKGTRPLKTKADLTNSLGLNLDDNYAYNSDLELILEILVGSGLVLRFREESGDRYQLVHDYLVQPIRQRNNFGIAAELEKVRQEKTQAEAAQKLSQEQLNRFLQRRLREARIVGAVLALLSVTVAGLWWQADAQKRTAQLQTKRAERSELNLQISALTASSEALFASNKEFDALLETLRAWRQMKNADGIQPDTKMRVVTALQQAVYGVEEANRLEGHSDIVWGVTFSPDGKLLASGGRDKKVNIWRPDGKLIQTFKAHDNSVTDVNFSPDGQFIASASTDKTAKIWRRTDVEGKFATRPEIILKGHQGDVYNVSFSPDNQLLATSSKDKTIKLWRRDGTLIKTLQGHQKPVNWVSFSPDGNLLASASDDKTVKIWRRDGSLVTTLSGHTNQVTALTFSPDGNLLVSGGEDKTVRIWTRQDLEPKNQEKLQFRPAKILQGHNSKIWSVQFSLDGQQFATASDDNTIKLWSRTGNLVKTFRGHSDSVTSIAFSPNKKLLASTSYDKTIKLWSLNPPAMPVLRGHQDRVNSVAWSPDGQILASASRDKTVKLWQDNGQLLKTLTGHTARVTSVSFHPNGQLIASGSFDRTVKLWERDGHLRKTLIGHRDSVTSVSFSPDGQIIASASKDKTVKLWQRDGKLIATLLGHQGWVNNVTFSPDGNLIATASDDQTVKLWQRDGTLLRTFSPHEGWVLGVSFSPTDHLLASASWDNTVKLWRKDGTLWKTLLKGYSDSVNSVTFSPDGKVLAAASWDSTVKLWSREGKLLKTFTGHTAPVLGVSFSPDGKKLASASDDKTIIIWNLNLDDLLMRACSWVDDYLSSNRNLEGRDSLRDSSASRSLCEGIVQKQGIGNR